MTTVHLDGESLTPAGVARIARGACRVALAPEARARNERAQRTTLALLARAAPVYGLNTGVGALKTTAVDPAARDDYQRRLLRSHASGAGARVSAEIARATLAVRANQLAAGGAGVHPALLDGLVAALDAGAAPRFRELGSLGTGDVTALAEVGLALLGESAPGETRAAGVELGPRDGLMLMSSNAHSVAEAALCTVDLARLLSAAEAVAAVSFEAAGANPSVLDARVHAARPHPGQVACAARLRALLEGYAPASPRLQDSFAFRCLPQVYGVLREAHAHLERVVSVELNAAAENALLDAVEGTAIPNGNFHGAPLATALDTARNAASQVAALAAARLSDLLAHAVTGLPQFLAEEPGPDSGLMILEYTANGALAELYALGHPVARSVSISSGIENHGSFATLAARQTTRAVELLAIVLACELLAAARALRMRGATPTGRGVRPMLELVLDRLPTELADRPLTLDLDRAAALLLGENLP